MDCRPQGTGGRLCLTLRRAMGKEALGSGKAVPCVATSYFRKGRFSREHLDFGGEKAHLTRVNVSRDRAKRVG